MRLIVANGPNKGHVHTLATDAPTLIGRHSRTVCVDYDHRASRKHAAIAFKRDRWIIKDLHSSNGTFVNGQKVHASALHEGDRIQIGRTVLLFTLKPARSDKQRTLPSANEKTLLLPESRGKSPRNSPRNSPPEPAPPPLQEPEPEALPSILSPAADQDDAAPEPLPLEQVQQIEKASDDEIDRDEADDDDDAPLKMPMHEPEPASARAGEERSAEDEALDVLLHDEDEDDADEDAHEDEPPRPEAQSPDLASEPADAMLDDLDDDDEPIDDEADDADDDDDSAANDRDDAELSLGAGEEDEDDEPDDLSLPVAIDLDDHDDLPHPASDGASDHDEAGETGHGHEHSTAPAADSADAGDDDDPINQLIALTRELEDSVDSPAAPRRERESLPDRTTTLADDHGPDDSAGHPPLQPSVPTPHPPRVQGQAVAPYEPEASDHDGEESESKPIALALLPPPEAPPPPEVISEAAAEVASDGVHGATSEALASEAATEDDPVEALADAPASDTTLAGDDPLFVFSASLDPGDPGVEDDHRDTTPEYAAADDDAAVALDWHEVSFTVEPPDADAHADAHTDVATDTTLTDSSREVHEPTSAGDWAMDSDHAAATDEDEASHAPAALDTPRSEAATDPHEPVSWTAPVEDGPAEPMPLDDADPERDEHDDDDEAAWEDDAPETRDPDDIPLVAADDEPEEAPGSEPEPLAAEPLNAVIDDRDDDDRPVSPPIAPPVAPLRLVMPPEDEAPEDEAPDDEPANVPAARSAEDFEARDHETLASEVDDEPDPGRAAMAQPLTDHFVAGEPSADDVDKVLLDGDGDGDGEDVASDADPSPFASALSHLRDHADERADSGLRDAFAQEIELQTRRLPLSELEPGPPSPAVAGEPQAIADDVADDGVDEIGDESEPAEDEPTAEAMPQVTPSADAPPQTIIIPMREHRVGPTPTEMTLGLGLLIALALAGWSLMSQQQLQRTIQRMTRPAPASSPLESPASPPDTAAQSPEDSLVEEPASTPTPPRETAKVEQPDLFPEQVADVLAALNAKIDAPPSPPGMTPPPPQEVAVQGQPAPAPAATPTAHASSLLDQMQMHIDQQPQPSPPPAKP